jgi:ABC-type polar amino acid transport system ATPase subunit
VIDVTNVIKRYGVTTMLNRATFRIAEGQLATILGPSGCGKSTTLPCLNRLERFDDGLIRIGDVEVRGTASGRLSAAEEGDLVRRVRLLVGMVFRTGGPGTRAHDRKAPQD